LRRIGDAVKKVIPDVHIEINKDISDKRNYRVRFDKITERLGFRCERQVCDEIKIMKEHILSSKGMNVNDSRFSNYRTFVGTEVI
jgi:hypothetical protein